MDSGLWDSLGGRSGWPRRWDGAIFAATGAGLVLSYAALWLQPLWLGRFNPFSGESPGVTVLLGADWAGLAHFVASILVPTTLYVLALVVLPRAPRRLALRVAVPVAVLAPALMVFTFPALAADVFDYLMAGRILVEHGDNPYLATPYAYQFDAYFPPVVAKLDPVIYGPLWVWMSAVPLALFGEERMAALLFMKGLALGSHLGVAALVWAMASRVRPGSELRAFVAYAWNPLPILYFAGDGHNDALMLLLVVAGVYLAIRERWDAALPLIVAAALVKFVPLVLIPYFLVRGRRQPLMLTTGCLLGAALALCAFLPLWAGLDTFDGLKLQAERMTSSPGALAAEYGPDFWIRPAAGLFFAVGYLIIARRAASLVEGVFWIFALYFFTVSLWTKPWYFTWVIPFAAALGGRYLVTAVLAGSGALASHIVGGWGWFMDWFGWQERWGMKAMELWLTACTYSGWTLGGLMAIVWRMRRRGAPAMQVVGPPAAAFDFKSQPGDAPSGGAGGAARA